MKQVIMLLVMTFSVALTLPVQGGEFGSLTAAELKALIDRGEPGLVIIDSRSTAAVSGIPYQGGGQPAALRPRTGPDPATCPERCPTGVLLQREHLKGEFRCGEYRR